MASPEQSFWSWFLQNEDRLFNFQVEQDVILDELHKALVQYCPDLTFEFSTNTHGVREFVLSAGGVKSLFPAVEQLVAAAPPLPRWKLIKYRQRMNDLMQLLFRGMVISRDEVQATLGRAGGELAVMLFIPKIEDSNTRNHVGFLLLDQALGEFDVATKIGPIEFHPMDAHPNYPRFSLTELPARFDDAYRRLVGS